MTKLGPMKNASKGEAPGFPGKPLDPQLMAFDEAMKLFHTRDFAAALPLFEEASHGKTLDVAQTAQLHARMCRQRLGAPKPTLTTAEDYYAYGLALITQRRLAEAEQALAKAGGLTPRADYIHYSLALARGLQGDYRGAAESLAKAIELQPANRSAARADADFHEILQHSPVRELVYAEKVPGH